MRSGAFTAAYAAPASISDLWISAWLTFGDTGFTRLWRCRVQELRSVGRYTPAEPGIHLGPSTVGRWPAKLADAIMPCPNSG